MFFSTVLLAGAVALGQAQAASAPPPQQQDVSLKFNGLLQSRFEWTDGSAGRFYVKRGRLKATAEEPSIGKLFLHADFSDLGVSLMDAEAWVYVKGLAVVAGQGKVPFGYEIAESSGERPFPERSRVTNALFPGIRDQQVRVQGAVGRVTFAAGVLDGDGLALGKPGVDASARVGVKTDAVSGGVSGYYGLHKTRVGADVEAKVSLPRVGPLALRAEAVRGTDDASTTFGWYASAMQAVGDHLAFGARYDFFDHALGRAGDGVSTLEPVVQWLVSDHVALTAAYAWVLEHDDVATAQVQFKF